jgi:ionotropic kainate glutamate receptor 4
MLCIAQVSMALIHDAVQLFARALHRLDSPSVDIKPLDCASQNNWGHGTSLINFMKDVSITANSGHLLSLLGNFSPLMKLVFH